jgi:ATP-dependent DNA ligase
LLFRKSTSVFVAFDLLYLNGKDLRTLPLTDPKRHFRKLLRRKHSRVLYLDHFENDGRLLFEQIVKEVMVCKRKSSRYRVMEKPSPHWIKVQNPRYSQAERTRGIVRAQLSYNFINPRYDQQCTEEDRARRRLTR